MRYSGKNLQFDLHCLGCFEASWRQGNPRVGTGGVWYPIEQEASCHHSQEKGEHEL